MLKLHELTLSGFRQNVRWWFLETNKSVVFVGGAEIFYQFNLRLKNKSELNKYIKNALEHQEVELQDNELTVLVDEWATTGNRWQAEKLGKTLLKRAEAVIRK